MTRALEKSHYFPSSGIAAAKELPESARVKILQALLDFRPKGRHGTDIYHWNRTEMPNGFIAAREEDYEHLREWLSALDMLN